MSGRVISRRLPDAAATEALGVALAHALATQPGLVVYLHGELGAGKTTLVRAWLRALGVTGTIRSPTYTLVEPYEVGGRSLLHLDLYRLAEPEELLQLGVYDTPPESSTWLVEWPERGAGELPPADLAIGLGLAGEGREVRLEAGPAIAPLLDKI